MHLIQVIGEATAGLSDDLTAAHAEVPWRQIVAIRNRVAHGYFEVDLNILWDVAIGDVPRVADQVRTILAELTPGTASTLADPSLPWLIARQLHGEPAMARDGGRGSSACLRAAALLMRAPACSSLARYLRCLRMKAAPRAVIARMTQTAIVA